MNERLKYFPLMIVPKYELLTPGTPASGEADAELARDDPGRPIGAPCLHLIEERDDDQPAE